MVTDRDVYISEEIKKRDSEIERLRAALEPFAKVARVFDEDVRCSNTPRSGAWYYWGKMIDEKPVDYILTVEHMRQARAALEEGMTSPDEREDCTGLEDSLTANPCGREDCEEEGRA